jgi:hypothetical protein
VWFYGTPVNVIAFRVFTKYYAFVRLIRYGSDNYRAKLFYALVGYMLYICLIYVGCICLIYVGYIFDIQGGSNMTGTNCV